MADRVPVLTPEGKFGTIDAADVDKLPLGARVLTKKEVAAKETEEAYEQQSTGKKIATVASMAGPAGYPLHAYLRSKGAVLPPGLEAYAGGVSEGFTGGLATVGEKEAIRAVGGDQAARAFAETAQKTKEAHEGLYHAGEVAGFVGSAIAGGPKAGLGAAGKAIPGVAIGAAGEAAENLAARGLAGVAERGVLGRAAATAGELGARGAVEGALYGGAHQLSEDMLGDHEVAADKVFSAMGLGALGGAVGGAALGAGGSLAASSVRGTVGAARGALTRIAAKGAETATEAAARAETAAGEAVAKGTATAAKAADEVTGAVRRTAEELGEATGTSATQEAGAARGLLHDLQSVEGQKGLAYDQAWKAIGAGNGLQSTKYAARAAKYLENGTRDVGEVLMRNGVINVEDGIINAMRAGTPEDMVPKIVKARAAKGEALAAMTGASPATVGVADIAKAFDKVSKPYETMLGQRGVADSVQKIGTELLENLGVTSPTDKVPIQKLLEQRITLDNLVYKEAKALDPGGRVEALRNVRGELEELITKALDEAGEGLPGETAAKYKALKRDYTALSIAQDVANDSATRMSKGASLGMRDMLFGSGSGGISGLAMSIGHKIVRERGNAGAAVLLHRMADLGTITAAVRSVDDLIGRAAEGLTREPAKAPLPELPEGTIRDRAKSVLDKVARFQADPEGFAQDVARHTEPIGTTAPNLASAVSQRFTDAMAFLVSKVPPSDPDPMDPHPAPHLTDAQEYDLAQYDWYLDKPSRFFAEAAHGKFSFEGAEVAKVLMPGAYQDLQMRLAQALVDLRARGVAPPYEQQRKIGLVMDFAAVPEQRIPHMQFLQQNVQPPPPDAPQPGAAPAPRRPFKNPTQPSVFDDISELGPGRRRRAA